MICYTIEHKIAGKYLRFGDGDFNLMEGIPDMLSKPSIELQEDLLKTFKSFNKYDMLAVNYHCNELNTLEPKMGYGIHEVEFTTVRLNIEKVLSNYTNLKCLYSAVSLHHEMINNPTNYVKVLRTIKSNGNTIILHDKAFSTDKLTYYFGKINSIQANGNNSYLEKDRICKEFDTYVSKLKGYTTILLALGCGGRAICNILEKILVKYDIQGFILDFGSSIDVLMNKDTRLWINYTKPNMKLIHTIVSHNSSLDTLGKIYDTDKATYHMFTTFYDDILGSRKEKIKNILEIGIYYGNSLRMLHSYFNLDVNIHALDINLGGDPQISNVKCLYADQSSSTSLEYAIKEFGNIQYDIILDDGSHVSTHQRTSLRTLWPFLRQGGLYIIEDLHTNVKDWYPNHPHYYDETPTVLEDICNYMKGSSHTLPIDISTIDKCILLSKPKTTSILAVLYKN
jgi:demethylmacrocin O-methyltransferase